MTKKFIITAALATSIASAVDIYREAGDDTIIQGNNYDTKYGTVELKDQAYTQTGEVHTDNLIIHADASLSTGSYGLTFAYNSAQIGGFSASVDGSASGHIFRFGFSQNNTITAEAGKAIFDGSKAPDSLLRLGYCLTSGSTLYVKNALLTNETRLQCGDTSIAGQTVNLQDVTIDLSTYRQTGGSGGLTVGVDDKYTLDLTWSIFQQAKITGELTLQLDDDMFNDILNNANEFEVLVDIGNGADISSNDELSIKITNSTGQSFLNFDSSSVSGGAGSYIWNLSSIPEPSTATLSLLALAGLAARRRRV